MPCCSVSGCCRPSVSRKMCNLHYVRMQRHGSVDAPKRYKNIAGQRFGNYVALAYVGRRGNSAIWTFRCDCQAVRAASTSTIIAKPTAPCAGCRASKAVDMVGWRFGRLSVVAPEGKTKAGGQRWRCACDCGGDIVATGMNLRRGDYVSCGCRKSERMTEFNLAREAARAR